ncbi:MAG: helix-turn-helix domain-containing protein [Eubacterium sp.]|nr:helix-turn-helix domain-containing protein [Eubacterium sp.]
MDSKTIGKFIKEQRSNKELTQKQLAEKLGVTDKAISRWETGKGIPDVSLLIPLSNVLEVSINEILLGEKIEEEKKIEKYEETIVNTLTTNKKQISKLHKIIYALLVAVEIVAIYGFTIGASPSDAMGLLLGPAFIVTPLVSLMLGSTNISFKFKAIFPWIVLIAFFPSNYLYWDTDQAFEVGIMYGLAHLIFSYVFVIIGTGIVKLIPIIISKIKEKGI